MSLFGDDDVPSRSKSTGLFDDDQKPAGKSGSGLFDDGFDGNDSPWAFPTPKKGDRGSLVKSLLPASDVPDSYIDAFDALLDAGDRAGNGISVDGAKKLLAGSGIPGDTQSKILEIVAQPDQDVAGLGRNEFNVLFALLGLAQEGDDVTLDSVDERRPRPRLKSKHQKHLPCRRKLPVNKRRVQAERAHRTASSPLVIQRQILGAAQTCTRATTTTATTLYRCRRTARLLILLREQRANSRPSPRPTKRHRRPLLLRPAHCRVMAAGAATTEDLLSRTLHQISTLAGFRTHQQVETMVPAFLLA
jgi:hypothetical protein